MWGISYWVFPLISGFTWLGMIIAMLVTWNVEGRPFYASMGTGQTITYISDVGAQGLKPLFITGSVITTIFLDFSFASERWLRHRGRLAANQSLTEKVLSGLSLGFALVGTVGLICLSIFDTLRHPTIHNLFLLLFVGGYIISAVFICWEYQRLGIRYRQHRVLRISFWIKLVFIIVEVVLAIAFGSCMFRRAYNAAAVLEWAVSFIFTFYVLSFFIDLLPAVRTKGEKGGRTELEMEQNDESAMAHSRSHEHSHHANVNGSGSADSSVQANGAPFDKEVRTGPGRF